jgi:hypothetical protein
VATTNTADSVKFMWGMLVVALGVALYSAYCLAAAPGVREQAAQVPTLTCDELIRNGPGGRLYVALTEACLLGKKSVGIETDWETGSFELYHPLYSASRPKPPRPRDLALLLCITDEMERRRLRDDWNRRERLGQPGLSAFTCEVGRGDRLPAWARDGLKAEFPGIQPSGCWVVTVSGYEPTAGLAAQYLRHGIGSGLAATVLLLGWGIWCWRRRRGAVSRATPNTPVGDAVGSYAAVRGV